MRLPCSGTKLCVINEILNVDHAVAIEVTIAHAGLARASPVTEQYQEVLKINDAITIEVACGVKHTLVRESISIEIFGALQVIQMPLNLDPYHNGNGRVNAPELLRIVDVWNHSVHRQAASSFAARLMTTFYNRRVILSKTWQLSPLL